MIQKRILSKPAFGSPELMLATLRVALIWGTIEGIGLDLPLHDCSVPLVSTERVAFLPCHIAPPFCPPITGDSCFYTGPAYKSFTSASL